MLCIDTLPRCCPPLPLQAHVPPVSTPVTVWVKDFALILVALGCVAIHSK